MSTKSRVIEVYTPIWTRFLRAQWNDPNSKTEFLFRNEWVPTQHTVGDVENRGAAAIAFSAYVDCTNPSGQGEFVGVCASPRGGDVIERDCGRDGIIVARFADLGEARQWAQSWYRAGPNGPVRSAQVRYYRTGDLVYKE